MITIYGKTLEDYKRNDPDGASGYWMALGMMCLVYIGVTGMLVGFLILIKGVL
jgi:hypothetical protein